MDKLDPGIVPKVVALIVDKGEGGSEEVEIGSDIAGLDGRGVDGGEESTI